jgi:CMP-N,N'-diacetyllegionaminic acid synthase
MIPARGGSKRIPNKNIKLLGGKPCIQYTIECAIEAGVSRIIVSTDSPQIAEIVESCGAEVPFIRPKELSGDHVSDFPVVEHCLNFLEEHENWVPDLFVFLRPTMPMRKPEELIKCLQILESNSKVDCVRTTCPVPYPPYWMKRQNEHGLLEPFCENVRPYQYTRSQDLPETVMCDGYVDATRVSVIRKHRQVVAGNIYGYYRDDPFFVDLDEEKDWQYAEYLFQNHSR